MSVLQTFDERAVAGPGGGAAATSVNGGADASAVDAGAAGRAQRQAAIERAVYRRALVLTGGLLAVLTVLGVGIGAMTAGTTGVWGAVMGVALAALFCAPTIWSMKRSVGTSPTTMAALVMGVWLGKLVVLIAALALLRGHTFYHPVVLFVVLALGAIGSAALDAFAVTSSKMTYVDAA
ncbi:MAG: hypothetical protein LBH13_05050 [Cellulomonadaceae bacterium]|jgi:hypothetical protein|nr:hypothetical protein [Cellulomonadaceae bacterium]